ncbi:RNA pseudouridine synthase [Neolewinella lacunae]|uniref:RNA pseudouridine synthase n=1 Tax=Neolewinella lacunae TaxID=1517758 RepID=A0A923T9X9_9BACT|nr:RNA pseudouridine synthase [Neolewinella lacunae]MBC6995548.1 RNA pseudouridine synthase [Neolewinella lacunae]MDN3635584.1 RNA pseudouridine synthase [Neolewinella lacunae]
MEDKSLEILAEGPRWVVINKPAGIATERNFTNDTVEARAQVQWKRPGSSGSPFVGIVHRLDRPVSGTLLLARNKSTLVFLNEAFARREVTKTYWALTDKPLPAAAGTLRHYLLRDQAARRAVASTRPLPGAQEATLSYQLLAHTGGHFHWEIQLETGRYHQIRAQLAAAGAPILGDAAYGSRRIIAPQAIALHARRLSFPTPEGELLTVEAPPPVWFAGAV